MKIDKKIFSLFFLLLSISIVKAQDKKPKIALVLSGGGAKGIAHIPTLQAMDSLGIVPDIIIGTSMGSIVGALYASGYSGDSIASVSKSTDWTKLFSSNIPVTAVSNEEKSEYKRYLVELEWEEGRIRKKTSIISDQNINAFFNEMTYPVNNIKHFDKLPIPFRAVATDIVNGKEVVLEEGSLSFAMRSSMSIPAVFAPMEYKDILLVDGGVLNNFPTDIAKKWGADIIIGSDVGGGMEPKEKLNSPVTVVFQSAMLASNLKVPENKKLCDVLIDHTKYLTHSTGSFGKNVEIYEEGKIATEENILGLVSIAERLKNYKQIKPQLPKVSDKVLLDTIVLEGISSKNMDLFRSRVNLTTNESYTLKEIKAASNNALGTNLFDAISFHLFRYNNKSGLRITAKEKTTHIFKGAIHFDDFRGVGLFLNYTGRNLLGESSRILASIDLSNDLRYRLQYQKNFGTKKDWWFRSDFYGEKLDQKTFFEGQYSGDLRNEHIQFDNQINFNLDSFRNYIGLGFTYDWNRLKPKIDPIISDNIYSLEHYDFKNIDLYIHYTHNTLDKVFYAEKGTFFKIKLSTSLNNNIIAESLDEFNIPDTEGALSPFTRFRYSYERRLPLNKTLTAILGLTGAHTFFNDNGENISYDDFGYAANYFLGGNIERPRYDSYLTPGLEENELAVTQFNMLAFSVQYSPVSSIYFTPHANIASVGFSDFNSYLEDFYKPTGTWVEQFETSLVTTIGLTTSYNSIIGPVDFDISWTNKISGATYFLGIGYHFNP